jgi:hypothetical protein
VQRVRGTAQAAQRAAQRRIRREALADARALAPLHAAGDVVVEAIGGDRAHESTTAGRAGRSPPLAQP